MELEKPDLNRPIGERERLVLRRQRVMDLRTRGKRIEQITEIWNTENPDFQVKHKTIQDDIKKTLEKAVQDTTLDVKEYRELLIARLDQALSADGFQKQIERGSLMAIDRMIKLVDQYAKLTGANMPVKIAATDGNGDYVSRLTDDERDRRLLELLDRAEARKLEIEGEVVEEGEVVAE